MPKLIIVNVVCFQFRVLLGSIVFISSAFGAGGPGLGIPGRPATIHYALF